ncbi:MAG: M28 family metallopeptidase [Candidatus Helarchaeota archaeon]
MKLRNLIIIFLIFNVIPYYTEIKSNDNYLNIIYEINNNINKNNIINTVSKLCENNSRITGTLNCNYSAFYIRNALEKNNISNVFFQYFPFNNTKAINVIGKLKNQTKLNSNILLMAHYDSISVDNIAPGANDNAASVACIIEIARLLQIILKGIIPQRNLIVLLTSGEEESLCGSNSWIINNPQTISTLLCVINFDMIGYGEYHTVISNEDSNWLARYIIECGTTMNLHISKSYAIYPATARSDHANFMYMNIPTAWIFEQDDYYVWMHTAQDTIDKINFSLVSNCAKLFTFILYKLMIEKRGTNYSIIGLIFLNLLILLPIGFYFIRKININKK